MMKAINTLIKYENTYIVEESHSAKVIGSGSLEVLATPMLIAYMENCCCLLLKDYLDDDESSVGTIMNMSHDAPTLLGKKVLIKATLVNVDRRKLTFEVEAYEKTKLIGKAMHTRFLINSEQFMDKAKSAA